MITIFKSNYKKHKKLHINAASMIMATSVALIMDATTLSKRRHVFIISFKYDYLLIINFYARLPNQKIVLFIKNICILKLNYVILTLSICT